MQQRRIREGKCAKAEDGMLLKAEQSREIWRTHGAWVKEGSDNCGKVNLDSVIWTIRGERKEAECH